MSRRHHVLSGRIAVAVAMIGTALPAQATPVTDTFTGFITGVTSSNFDGPIEFFAGDVISGSVTFDPDNPDSSGVTASLTDATTTASYSFPSGGTDSTTGAPPTYTVALSDTLEFPPTYTDFTANLALAVVNESGTGTLFIDIPAEPINDQNHTGNPEETLTVTFDVPEPATIGILGLGFAGLVGLRRRALG
jgi:hypothetical protein